MTANTAGSPATADVIYGAPPKIYLHQLDSGELDKLSTASSPTATVIASFCGGAFLSLLPTAVSSLGQLKSQSFGGLELFYVLLDVALLGIGLYAGFLGAKNRGEVQQIISDIRSRLDGGGT
jgi:hypothetical protein